MNAPRSTLRPFQPRAYATVAASHPGAHLPKKSVGGPSGMLVTIGLVLAVGVPIYSTVRSSLSSRDRVPFSASHARISRSVCLENDFKSAYGLEGESQTQEAARPEARSYEPPQGGISQESARWAAITSEADMDPFALFMSEYV